MKLCDILNEASYDGNVGAMEMVMFYRIATDEQEELMKHLLDNGKTDDAWQLLQDVTGVKLHPMRKGVDVDD